MIVTLEAVTYVYCRGEAGALRSWHNSIVVRPLRPYPSAIRLCLKLKQLRVQAPPRQQFGVTANFDHRPLG